MNEYISKAFKALNEFITVEDPAVEPKEETPNKVKDLLLKDSSYNVIYDFDKDGTSYSLYVESTCDGDSCDATFDEFDINNINGVIVDVLDTDRNFIGNLHDITIDTSIQDTIEKANKIIDGDEKEILSPTKEEENEPESNERIFIKGEDSLDSEENSTVDIVKEESLVESKEFKINDKEELEQAKEILDRKNNDEDTIEQIVDVSAESVEDLKKTYIGSIVLRCPACHTMTYKDVEDLVKAENTSDTDEEIYNVGTKCPHCGSEDGFELVGQIATLDTNPEATSEAPVTVEEKPEIKSNDDKETEIELEPSKPEVDVEPMPELQTESADKSTGQVLNESSGRIEFCVMKDGNNIECFDEDEKAISFAKEKDADKVLKVVYGPKDENGDEPELSADIIWEKELKEEHDLDCKDSCEKHVCPKCGKEICECDKNVSESIVKVESDLLFETLDEEGFDKLIKKYLYETYFNVKDYKTVTASIDNENNILVLEGKILFKSGKEKNTKFTFEAKELTKKGKIKFSGMNEMFSNKKAYTLICSNKENKLLSESLSYSYLINENKVIGKISSPKKM